MGETLNLLFRSRENGTFELRMKESWSGRTVSGDFVPPYSRRQLNTLQKKLNNLKNSPRDLREIGHRLFLALCGSEIPGVSSSEVSEQSVQAMLRGAISRTLRRRGTVALTFSFANGCDEFVRYPWELLHNGEHFLLASGVFTLTRTLLRPDEPVGCELPVHPPLRVLYISASPKNCVPLETGPSLEALQRALADPIDKGQIVLDRIEQVTFDDLVSYLSSVGGIGIFDDSEVSLPCYVVHFDGYGTFGRPCPNEGCLEMNSVQVSKCVRCNASLSRIKPQTYLCFCDEEGNSQYIDTQSLSELFMSSDVRLAVFSASETAISEVSPYQDKGISFETILATALVTAQIPAVVTMQFSLQDDLSPTFIFHFYEALAQKRTLEEALSRARHAMLPKHNHQGWFIPVLYRYVREGREGPVALLADSDTPEEGVHLLAYPQTTPPLVVQERELRDLIVRSTDVRAQQIMNEFLSKGTGAAEILVGLLFDSNKRVLGYVIQTLARMDKHMVVPALLGVKDAIPLLMNLLSDYAHGDAAESILLQCGPQVLPLMASEFDTIINRARVRRPLFAMSLVTGVGHRLRVFLSYSSEDKSTMRELYWRLQADSIDLGFNEENLLPGQDLQKEILKAVYTCDMVIIFLSHKSVSKVASIQPQNNFVLNMAKSEEKVPILILRLEECAIPAQLKHWQVVDLFADQGYEHLLRVFSHRANQILSNYYWERSRGILRQTLFERGSADPSVFPDVPVIYVDTLFGRYMQEHPDDDLEHNINTHILHLRTANNIQRIGNLLKQIDYRNIDSISTRDMRKLEEQIEKLLQAFSEIVGLKAVKKQSRRGLVAFLIEMGMTFEDLQIPKQLPFLASLEQEISDEAIEHLRRYLFSGILGSEIQVAILLLFCDDHKLNLVKRRITTRLGSVHARDIVVINDENLLEIVSAKEPEHVLRSSVLSQMNLVAVAPYTIAGPTPSRFFFGREHELREISDHLSTTSYILIGGRRIGKTSILNRLHCVRLPEYGFRTLSFDCSTVSTYEAFLSTSIRDWKPEPPVNAPVTFGELLRCPPDDKPLILLLDETDKILPADRENAWQLFNTLRTLINARRIQVVLSGERVLRDALQDASSPLFNFANLILLGPLDYNAIDELVTQPTRRLGIEIVDQASVVAHIYEFTSGHPNVVQRLCRRLIERLNDQGNRRITLDDVKAITEDPRFQEYDFLQTYWDSATPLEKIITLVLSHEARGYHLQEVRHLLHMQARIQPRATDTKDALDRLVELRSILKRTQFGYEFAVEAFPRVLVNTTTVEDLLAIWVEQYSEEGLQR